MTRAELTPEIGQAGVWQAIREWWRTNLSRLGLLRTTQLFAGEMWEFVRDATPARRKQRYGDIEFDCDHRVDTTAGTVSLRTHLMGVLVGGPYQPCDPALFQQTISKLHIDHREYDFVDLGSGKGRALLMRFGVSLPPRARRRTDSRGPPVDGREHPQIQQSQPAMLCGRIALRRRTPVPLLARADRAVPV